MPLHTGSRGWDDIGYNFLVDPRAASTRAAFARPTPPGSRLPERTRGAGAWSAPTPRASTRARAVPSSATTPAGRGARPRRWTALVNCWPGRRPRAPDRRRRGNDAFVATTGASRGSPTSADTATSAGDRLPRRAALRAAAGGPSAGGRARRHAASAGGAAPASPARLPPPSRGIRGWMGRPRRAGPRLRRRPQRPATWAPTPCPAPSWPWPPPPPRRLLAGRRRRRRLRLRQRVFAGSATGGWAPVVHLEPTPSGRGYWVVSAVARSWPSATPPFRGQVFPLPVATVGLAATPTGQGYWVATADAQVFAFGDAVLQAGDRGLASRPSAPGTGPPKPGGAHGGHRRFTRRQGVLAAGPRRRGVLVRECPFHGSVGDRQPYERAVSLESDHPIRGRVLRGRRGRGGLCLRRRRPAPRTGPRWWGDGDRCRLPADRNPAGRVGRVGPPLPGSAGGTRSAEAGPSGDDLRCDQRDRPRHGGTQGRTNPDPPGRRGGSTSGRQWRSSSCRSPPSGSPPRPIRRRRSPPST